MLPKIEILDMKLTNGRGNLRAFIDIKVDDTILRSYRVIHEDGKRPWVGGPQISYKNPMDGQITYLTVVTFPKEVQQLISAAILDGYRREMEKRDDKQQFTK